MLITILSVILALLLGKFLLKLAWKFIVINCVIVGVVFYCISRIDFASILPGVIPSCLDKLIQLF